MNALSPAVVVHYYDTRAHAIACGVRGSDHRSTKHSRGVTCHACVGLLGSRPTAAAVVIEAAASGAAP